MATLYKGSKKFDLFINSLSKWQVKLLFALFALTFIIGVVIFTRSMIDEIVQNEQNYLRIYSKYTILLTSTVSISLEGNDAECVDYQDLFDQYLDLYLEEVIESVTFPLIFTDPDGNPLPPYDTTWTENIIFPMNLDEQGRKAFMEDYIDKMESSYEPIELYDPKSGNVLQKVYYTHSSLVDKLQYFPLVAILIISVYVFIGYLAFSTTRNHEQSKIWVGMAKEAAHQMGTPLSSLMAWMEILKFGKEEPETINSTLGEMENDVSRLSTIATRFSKIGSLPEKELFDLAELVENVCVYFDKRLPHLGKKVEIVRNFTGPKPAMVNKDLIAWVFENLLKNAAEAIESKSGTITISMREITGNKIYIYVKDNGKGMQPKYKKTVFYPGFSTKKRGWGLGLSLSKRIVEEYHSGKIYIKETVSGKGTTFAIEIPVDS